MDHKRVWGYGILNDKESTHGITKMNIHVIVSWTKGAVPHAC